MAQTSPQTRLERVKPPHLLLISIPRFAFGPAEGCWYSRLTEAKEMAALDTGAADAIGKC
jgi:hypothetical protein